MRYTISFILVLLIAGCINTRIETPPSELLKELQGKTETKSRNSKQWQAVYASVLGELQSGMENADIGSRRSPMQAWQQICWNAGRPGAEKERRAAVEAMCPVLAQDIPPYTALWLIRQLEHIGGRECVSTLEELLGSENPQIAEHARRALANNPAVEAAKVLTRHLTETTSPAQIIAYLNALVPHASDRVIPALIPHLTSHQPGVFRACLSTLSAAGTPGAYRTIAEVPDPANPALEKALLDARLICAEHMEKNGHNQEARNAYDYLYHSNVPETVRVGALSGLLRMDPKRLPEIIDSIRGSGSARLLAATVDFLKTGVDDATLSALAGELYTFSGTVQILMLPILAERQIPAGRQAALTALNHDSTGVRVAAIRTLAVLGDRATVPQLIHLAQSNDPLIAKEALSTLQKLPGADVDAGLLQQTEGDDLEHITTAISLLSYRRVASSLPRLLALANHSSRDVRHEAYKAIGVLGTADVAPAVLKSVLAADADDAEAGAKALVALCRGVEDESERTASLRSALETADATQKPILLKTLGKLAGKPAYEAVNAHIDTPDEAVRDAAIRALADWPDDIAVEALTTLASSAESPIHRVLTLRGAVRLLGTSSPRPDAERLAILTTLLSRASRDEDRRTIISGLGTIHQGDTLNVLQECAQEKTLREEAGVALIQVALGIAHNNRDRAEKAMKGILALDISDTLRVATSDALKALEEFDGFITSWLIAGPYVKKEGTTSRIDMLYDPETKAGDSTEWCPYVGNADPRVSWQLDLIKVVGGSNRTAYMLNWIRVGENTPALLEMGSDDAIKVWLNGEEILRNDVARPCKRGEEKVPVTLKTGWNSLMLKITQGGGGWGACARLRTVDGNALEGWTYVRNPAQPNEAIADLRELQLAPSAHEALTVIAKAVSAKNPKRADAINKALANTDSP